MPKFSPQYIAGMVEIQKPKISIKNPVLWLIIAVIVAVILIGCISRNSYKFIGIPDDIDLLKELEEQDNYVDINRTPVIRDITNEIKERELEGNIPSLIKNNEESGEESILENLSDIEDEVYKDNLVKLIKYEKLPNKREQSKIPDDIDVKPLTIDETPAIPAKFGKKKRATNESKGEAICRKILEDAYPGYKFENTRPSWLINDETNRPLELDAYNEELGIALEYNGPQHYIFPNSLHSNIDEFLKQVRRDRLKKEKCDIHGVYLISVPFDIDHSKLKEYVTYYLPENYENRLEDERLMNELNNPEI